MKQNLDQITNIELIKKITDETSDSKYKDEILHNRMEEKHNPNFNYLCCVVKEKMKDRKIEYMLDDNIVELIACNCRNNEDIIERIVTALWASNEIEKTINYTPEIILERVIEYLILDLREIDNSTIINIIKENSEIDFIYLRGNHDINNFLEGEEKLQNIKTFEEEWKQYNKRSSC